MGSIGAALEEIFIGCFNGFKMVQVGSVRIVLGESIFSEFKAKSVINYNILPCFGRPEKNPVVSDGLWY